jgi:hypothetical protein
MSNGSDVYEKRTKEDADDRQKERTGSQGGQNSQTANPSHIKLLINETRINELETKLLVLEQNNDQMSGLLRDYERNFELQFHRLAQLTDNEKENRIKTERLLAVLSDKNNVINYELSNKINTIQDVMEREEKWKYDQREKDLELYKTILSKLTEKVSETVKLEVEARFKADLENKTFTHTIGKKALEEINAVKGELDMVVKESKDNLKENNRECSERAHNLSKYIDSLVQTNSADGVKQVEKMKNFMSKLTDQIKSNILNQDEQSKLLEGKVKYLESYTAETKDEIFRYVLSSEERQTKRLKEFYDYMDNLVRTNVQKTNERIDLLSDGVDTNFKIVTEELMDTRSKLATRINSVEDIVKEQFKVLVIDLENILDRVYKMETLVGEYDKQNNYLKKKVEQDIAEILSKIEVKHVHDAVLRRIEYEELKNLNDTLRDDLVEFGQNVHGDMGELMKNFETNYLNLFERSKLTFEQMNRMAQSNIQMFEEFETNMQKMQDEANYQEVRNLWDTMLEKVESEELRKQVSERKEVEHYLHGTVHELTEELKNFQTVMYQNHENLTQAVQKNKDLSEKILKGNEDGLQLLVEQQTKDIYDRIDELEEELLLAKAVEEQWHVMLNRVESDVDGDIMRGIAKQIDTVAKDVEELKREKVGKKVQEELDRLSRELVTQKKTSEELQVKTLMDNLLNHLEFDMIIGNVDDKIVKNEETGKLILSKLALFNDQVTKIDKDITDGKGNSNKVNDALDAKISDALERLKKENHDMWVNAVELSQTVNTPDGKQ